MPTPTILTSSEYPEYLSDELANDADVDRRVYAAETYVIERYRGRPFVTDAPLVFDTNYVGAREQQVLLAGWKEDADGNPDPAAMPTDLVERLRLVIGAVANRWYEEAGREDISRLVQGDRQVYYDNQSAALPSRLFRPLDKYDQREGFTGR